MREEWRKIPDWPYEVSDHGRVRRSWAGPSTTAGRVLKTPVDSSTGYPQVRLSNGSRDSARTFRVHRLVALVFLGPCPAGKVVNHQNGDKTDNRPDNLEYVSQPDNVAHALESGIKPDVPAGPQNPNAKLTMEQVREIRERYENEDTSHRKLARDYPVCYSTIKAVVDGERYKEADND